MKTDTAHRLPSLPGRQRSLRAFLAALLAVPSLLLHAADDNSIPSYINYRGRVLNSAGIVVGKDTPVNRKVTFRLWASPTSISTADLVYAEEQTVVILNGDFSALVGQGTRLPGAAGGTASPGQSSVVALANSFNHSERYLGVTVDDGTATPDSEITPRQQIVSSAFAFRSKFAENATNLASGTVSGTITASGSTINGGTYAGGAFNSGTFSGTFSGGTFTGGTFSSGSFSGTHSGNGASLTSLSASNISSGTLNAGLIGNGITSSQISSLDGGKITGNIASATIPAANVTGLATTDLSNYARLGGANQTVSAITSFSSGLFTTGSSGGGNPPGGNGVWIDFKNDTGYIGAFQGKNLILNVAGGFVSVGTGVPERLFHVIGAARVNDNLLSGSLDTGAISSTSINNNGGALSTGTLNSATINNSGVLNNTGRVSVSGRVGIGTVSPNSPLHVTGTGDQINKGDNTMIDHTSWHDEGGFADLATIYAEGPVICVRLRAFSDERIKRIQGVSDGVQDLKTLQKIEIANYRYVDQATNGRMPQKKVIAQQVEKCFPQAVSRTTGVVPDIFQKATLKDGWVNLKTDLKAGERVRLIADGNQETWEVLEIDEKNHAKFRTALKSSDDKVFVYGREVSDFRSVDYEAISMLNVSATQQIKKEKDAEVKALKDENADLRSKLAQQEQRLAKIEAADQAREAKFAALEKLLKSADKLPVRTAALKAAE